LPPTEHHVGHVSWRVLFFAIEIGALAEVDGASQGGHTGGHWQRVKKGARGLRWRTERARRWCEAAGGVIVIDRLVEASLAQTYCARRCHPRSRARPRPEADPAWATQTHTDVRGPQLSDYSTLLLWKAWGEAEDMYLRVPGKVRDRCVDEDRPELEGGTVRWRLGLMVSCRKQMETQ
jgi:hypothetical protein